MAVVCVAVISKQNCPLYLKTVGGSQNETDLQFQYLVHTCIDVIEEKVCFCPVGSRDWKRMLQTVVSTLSSSKGANDPREHYLGLLYPTEEFKIYGYATNTRVKFIIVTENTTIQSRDSDIKMLFKNLHVAYTDMFCNPFYTPGTKISSRTFEEAVSGIFQQSKHFSVKESL